MVVVYRGGRYRSDQLALSLQQQTEIAEQAHLRVHAGNIVKSEERKNQIERSGLKPTQIAVFHQPVIACRVQFPGLGDHLACNVDAGHLETESLREPRGSPRATAEIQRPRPRHVLAEDFRKIPVREVVRIGELELRVRDRKSTRLN